MRKVKINIDNSRASILLEINGDVHLVGIDKDKLEAITLLIKTSTKVVVPTGRTQKELRNFLNVKS